MISLLVAGCGQANNQPNPDEMPSSPLTLPLMKADLSFSGALTAHISEVRLFDCRTYPAGTDDFFRSAVLFQIGPQWYRLVTLTSGPRVQYYPTPTTTGHRGPGDYRGSADLTEQLVGPGGMVLGDHAWGSFAQIAISVTTRPKAVSLGTIHDPPPNKPGRITVAEGLDFAPRGLNYSGPGPTPAPVDELIHFHGGWSCEEAAT